jgi:hypothetical protein
MKIIKIKLADNLYKYEKEYEKEDCIHYWDEKLTKKNKLGTWRTCRKCRSTKLSL